MKTFKEMKKQDIKNYIIDKYCLCARNYLKVRKESDNNEVINLYLSAVKVMESIIEELQIDGNK